MIIVASGGILIELLNDRAFSLAPVDETRASELLGRLKLSKLPGAMRGQPTVNRLCLAGF